MFFIITLVEIIYVYYMLNIFKTKYTINHPYENIITNSMGKYFSHTINVSRYGNKICQFGHDASELLVIYLLLRYLCNKYSIVSSDTLYTFNKIVCIIVAICSLMNMNALVYLAPYFLIELFVIPNIL